MYVRRLSVDSQKLQLLTTNEIQRPISCGSLVTEKLGLKMEIPRADWTQESSRQEYASSELKYRRIVRLSYILFIQWVRSSSAKRKVLD